MELELEVVDDEELDELEEGELLELELDDVELEDTELEDVEYVDPGVPVELEVLELLLVELPPSGPNGLPPPLQEAFPRAMIPTSTTCPERMKS
jgi:hypothetical protein